VQFNDAPNGTPEPASLTLAGIALGAILFARKKLRRPTAA